MKTNPRGLLQSMSVGAALAPVLSLDSTFAFETDSSGQEASPGAKFVQMDPTVSFDKQIANNVAPVVLLSTFLVKPEHVEEFLAGFRKQFAIMRKQPGLISAQLHRGIAGSCLFMNYVIWASTDAFKHGFESSFRPNSSNILPERRFRLLCFRGWRCQECVWVSRSHLIRFCRRSVRIWRKKQIDSST
jgi:heme-degrading monooxygenase HmoA